MGKKIEKTLIIFLCALIFLALFSPTVFAAGEVSGAIEQTWETAATHLHR